MNIQTVTFHNMSFVNVTKPGELEIKYLKNNFGFSALHLDDYTNKTQTPKIETFKNYTLVVLDLPCFNSALLNDQDNGKAHFPPVPFPQFKETEKRRRIISSQVDFFVGKDYVVILHDGNLLPVSDMFAYCQKTLRNREELMGEGSVFLAYKIIDALVDMSFLVINELSTMIDKIDKELEKKPSQRTLEDISTTRRNIVVFHTMIKPVLLLFKQLEQGAHKQLNGKMQPFWGNVGDHLIKIWDRLEDNQELIEGISESNESLLASKTNEIVKVLTIYSAIILPLNLFASIYGMNVTLPFEDEPFTFALIILVMVVTSYTMLMIFKFKRWF
ncbi:MAG: hypothetical protein A3J69_02885 [Candidatus Levybacteria bacterium RIFCSPHIGHO2_02_FULL_42_12]|nr:MAG: hypothetical protein A3J69_02885 [Candidatus Levybacteria bacterium RIFCSPHIGHO2_02_FULL_42_12]